MGGENPNPAHVASVAAAMSLVMRTKPETLSRCQIKSSAESGSKGRGAHPARIQAVLFLGLAGSGVSVSDKGALGAWVYAKRLTFENSRQLAPALLEFICWRAHVAAGGAGAAKLRHHPGRRLGLWRLGLLRAPVHPHAEPGPDGGGRDPLHGFLRGRMCLHPEPRGVVDGAAARAQRHVRRHAAGAVPRFSRRLATGRVGHWPRRSKPGVMPPA